MLKYQIVKKKDIKHRYYLWYTRYGVGHRDDGPAKICENKYYFEFLYGKFKMMVDKTIKRR
jgi:hypothetical protein